MKKVILPVLIIAFAVTAAYSQVSIDKPLDLQGSLSLRDGGTVAVANGANSNVTLGAYSFFRLTGATGAFTITGLAGGTDGRIVTLYNTTSQTMTIANNTTSTAANQILTLTGGNFTTPAGPNALTLQYNTSLQRWLVIGGQNIQASTNSARTLVYTADGF